jgi:phosphatidylserine decarboxylase
MPSSEATLIDYLKALPQHIMPGHLISRSAHWLARWENRWFKQQAIDLVIRRFHVNMAEAAESDPRNYPSFNAFFTRPLRSDARPIASEEGAIVSPVDGVISQLGTIREGRILQAKGHSYSLEQLLGGQPERAGPFHGGEFITIYLAPRDYHRIHMPQDGLLSEMVHVPGRLFSVSPATTRVISGLFARNERVVSIFQHQGTPFALVKVGAVNVGSIETVWAGEVTPPAGRTVRSWHYSGHEATLLRRGVEMGRFNFGSTVILLFPPRTLRWRDGLTAGQSVRMGERIASQR